MKALIFGYGFIGQAFGSLLKAKGFELIATARTPEKRQYLGGLGVSAIDPTDKNALSHAASLASAILITPAPDNTGCPAFAALGDILKTKPKAWMGYLSTTGVYGDRDGGWVFEDSPLNATSREGQRRIVAERQWLSLSHHNVCVFRLPGLYGVGRSVLERLSDKTARRIHKQGQVFSRLYDEDCATALYKSMERPRKGGIYNLCDDEPAPADEVLVYAAKTYGFDVPMEIAFDEPSLSGTMRRFYAENKRVSNALAKAELGWQLGYPTYREGLATIALTLGLSGKPSSVAIGKDLF
jgi:nucleoside-diphosphate-sugar epimerase